jgi:hypothetical protein
MRSLAGVCLLLGTACTQTVVLHREQLPGQLWMTDAEGSRTTRTRDGTELFCCTQVELVGPVTTHVIPAGAGLRFVESRVEVYLPSPEDGALVLAETLATPGTEVVRFEEVSAGHTAALLLGSVAVLALVFGTVSFFNDIERAVKEGQRENE